jgi:release factor glutamine methyltransferase
MPGPATRAEPGRLRLPPVRTLEEWRRAARELFRRRDFESPAAESDHLLRHVLELRAVDLTLARDRVLTAAERRRLSRFLHRRLGHIPFQYLAGRVDFAGIELAVRPGVFIPRPETEGLVERVRDYLNRIGTGTVIDVGTGSGAIALALAAGHPGIRVRATDRSPDALRQARRNARRLGLADRVQFFAGDLTRPVPEPDPGWPVRVVVSNPPYIARRDRKRLDPEVVEHEPHLALFADEEGMGVIRRLAPLAARRLGPGGLLALEIGEDQGPRTRTLLETSGDWTKVRIERDLANRDRYALGIRAGREHG